VCHSFGCCFIEFFPNYIVDIEHAEVLMKTVELGNQRCHIGTAYLLLWLVINLINGSEFKGSVTVFLLIDSKQ